MNLFFYLKPEYIPECGKCEKDRDAATESAVPTYIYVVRHIITGPPALNGITWSMYGLLT